MPFVFWWENRGKENNGPEVDCYGRQSSAKLNYEPGGWCYSSAMRTQGEEIQVVPNHIPSEVRTPVPDTEEQWHAVQHTLGTDFSEKKNGGTILNMDNSGNVYKGAFDPNCAGTNEKWKIHHISNAFGANQNEDPTEDKYHFGYEAHGTGEFTNAKIPPSLNEGIMDSIEDRPMCWNLWNVVRHYAYIKYFRNKGRDPSKSMEAWNELERYTRKMVKGIYRTFKENKKKDDVRSTFQAIDGSSTNYGTPCLVHWTNSFVEIQSILERNARDHEASLVMFTGNVPTPSDSEIRSQKTELSKKYPNSWNNISDKL